MKNKQTGSAIILALVVVLITSFIAASMMTRSAHSIHELQHIQDQQNAFLAAEKISLEAKQRLLDDASNPRLNTLMDTFPIAFKKESLLNADVSGEMIDAQSKFNINNLAELTNQPGFIKLLQAIDPDLDLQTDTEIAINITSWLTGDKENQAYYAKQEPPYRSANRLMADSSELLLVKGITPNIYNKLTPFIIALPGNKTAININTAPAAVLETLPGISKDSAETIVKQRQITPFTTAPIINGLDPGSIAINSDYFLVPIVVHFSNKNLLLLELLYRHEAQGKTKVTTLWKQKA